MFDLNQTFKHRKGDDIYDSPEFNADGTKNDKREVLTLGSVCWEALMTCESSQKIEGTRKYKRWRIAHRIESANGSISFDSGEVQELKDCIGERFMPMIVGQAWRMLDPEMVAKEAKEGI